MGHTLDLARSRAVPSVSGSNTEVTTRQALAVKAPEVASVADPRAHYRWLVTISAGGAFEVCCLPETTAAEMALLYPRAELRPLPDAADEAAVILNERASERDRTEA